MSLFLFPLFFFFSFLSLSPLFFFWWEEGGAGPAGAPPWDPRLYTTVTTQEKKKKKKKVPPEKQRQRGMGCMITAQYAWYDHDNDNPMMWWVLQTTTFILFLSILFQFSIIALLPIASFTWFLPMVTQENLSYIMHSIFLISCMVCIWASLSSSFPFLGLKKYFVKSRGRPMGCM